MDLCRYVKSFHTPTHTHYQHLSAGFQVSPSFCRSTSIGEDPLGPAQATAESTCRDLEKAVWVREGRASLHVMSEGFSMMNYDDI